MDVQLEDRSPAGHGARLRNELAKAGNQQLGFRMDPHTNGPVITVHNTQTGELVRTIPSEEVLRVAKSIDSLKGVIFSEKM